MTCKPQCSVTVEETNLRQRGSKQQRQRGKPPTAQAQHNNNERTDEPETRPKAQDERGRRREAAREPKNDGRAEKEGGGKERGKGGEARSEERGRERAKGEERKERRRPGRKGGTRPGRHEAKQAKKDNRQPQEHERERQEDKLVPTTTQESNSLRAEGRDGRVVVRRRRRTAATANVVAPADFPTERAKHPDTNSDRSGEGGPENPSTRGTGKVVHASGRIGAAGLSTVWGDTAAVTGIAKTAQNARRR